MFSYINTVTKFLLFLYFLNPFLGFGQSAHSTIFFNWQKEDGLPSNLINAVEKDKIGFLWIATNDGLCRYNGPNSVEVYRQAKQGDSITNSLQSNYIRSLLCDSKGFLWIGTRYGGLTRFNPSKDKWITFQHEPGKKNSLSNNDILAITEDSKQRIWVGTEDGLNLFNQANETFTQFKLYDTYAKVQTTKAVLSIMEDDKGWIWAGTWSGGLHLLLEDENGNYNPNRVRHFQTTTIKAANNVWALFQDHKKQYWLGTHGGGILKMSLPQNASNKYSNQNWHPDFRKITLKINKYENVGSNTVQAILQDQFNNLWVGTTHGLFKLYNKFLTAKNVEDQDVFKTFEFFLPSENEMTLIGDNIKDIYEDDQGLIWIGTSDGLSQFNSNSNQFKNFNFSKDYYKMPYAPNIMVDSAKNIWVGMLSNGLLKYKIKNGILTEIENSINNLILGKRISTIYSPDGRWLYVGTELGITAVNLKTRKTKEYPVPQWVISTIPNLFIQTILLDRNGFIWFGTSVGLFRINSRTKSYDLFEPNKDNQNSISDHAICHIIEDSKGHIWIATYNGLNKIENPTLDDIVFERFFLNKKNPERGPISNGIVCLKEIDQYLYIGTDLGICRYNFSKEKFEIFNTNEYNLSVKSIEQGVKNDVWVSTSEGILNFNPDKETFKIFNKKDGLNNTAYRLGCSFKDNDNHIYFAYTNGFTFFAPEKLLSNEIPPPIQITEIEIYSRNKDRYENGMYTEKIELNHDDYRLSINYAALNYNRADKNQYKYRLVGLETKWNDIKFGRPIICTSLEPKEYRLEVKASNNDGIWNDEPTKIVIIKKPPYWETRWFRLLTLLLIGAIILLFFFWYTNNVRSHNEQLKIYNENLNDEIVNRKKIEQKLQKFNNELKRSNKDLEQFAYITSHDLKEPLRVIASFSSLLFNKYIDKLDKNGIQYLKFIDQGVHRMSNLVDSLLTYSIVGQKDCVYAAFNLNKLIQDKILDLSQLIREKNAIVEVGEFSEIIGQQEQIGMVFYNLINNALKFNTQKQPIISVNQELGDHDCWKFSIKDNGIGIEPQYQEQIFGIFKRLHNRSDYEGTGIGLSVCQKIILRHQGNIWLKSDIGKGTTFFFTIRKKLSSIDS